jgi:pre-mRNA-processing factor 40
MKWNEFYPIVKDKKEYVDMIGQSGSLPLDLWRDVMFDIDVDFEALKKHTVDALKKERIEINESSTLASFITAIPESLLTDVDTSVIKLLFEEVLLLSNSSRI